MRWHPAQETNGNLIYVHGWSCINVPGRYFQSSWDRMWRKGVAIVSRDGKDKHCGIMHRTREAAQKHSDSLNRTARRALSGPGGKGRR